MTLTVVSEQIGYSLASKALVSLTNFLNAHVVSSGNTVDLCLPKPIVGKDGHFTITVTVAFDLVPHDGFLAKE